MERLRRAILLPFAMLWLAGEWVYFTAIPAQVRVVERALQVVFLWPIERVVDLVELLVRGTMRLIVPLRPLRLRALRWLARIDDAVRPRCIALWLRVMRIAYRLTAPFRWISRVVHNRIIVPVAPMFRAARRFLLWRGAAVAIAMRLLARRFRAAVRSLQHRRSDRR